MCRFLWAIDVTNMNLPKNIDWSQDIFKYIELSTRNFCLVDNDFLKFILECMTVIGFVCLIPANKISTQKLFLL